MTWISIFSGAEEVEVWFTEVENLLASEDLGKDLTSVQNLQKKHAMLESNFMAQEVRCKHALPVEIGILSVNLLHLQFGTKSVFECYSKYYNYQLKALTEASYMSVLVVVCVCTQLLFCKTWYELSSHTI